MKTILISPCILLLFIRVVTAQTTGPNQTEYQSFGSNQVSEMVNLFTGDFSYKIPLFEIPGPNGSYPLVMNYQSGSRMNDESSWVGFGWNLNLGTITREMRGLPDDFNGENITHTNDRKPDRTYGLGVNASVEVVGADMGQVGATIGLMGLYNNYRGFTVTRNMGVSYSTGKALGDNMTATAGLDISLDNSNQTTVSLQAGLNWAGNQFNGSTSFNSREGLSDLKLSYARNGFGGGYSFAKRTYIPNPGPLMESHSVQLDTKLGGELFVVMLYGGVRLSYAQTQIKDPATSTPAYGYMYLQNKTEGSLLDFNREKDGILSDDSPNLAIPSLTHDIFSVAGDGMEGSFRAFRTDVPIVHDKRKTSDLTDNIGESVSAEVGFGNLVKIGLNANTSMSYTSSGRWDADEFKGMSQGSSSTGLKEYFYFKFNGETNLDRYNLFTNKGAVADLFNEDAARLRLEADDPTNLGVDFMDMSTPKYDALSELETTSGSHKDFPSTVDGAIGREPRARTIQHFTNREINQLVSTVGELKVEFMDEAGNIQTLARPNNEQLGAFIIYAEDGKRYVYALPVYNTEQHERRQSSDKEDCKQYVNDNLNYDVAHTDKFLYKSDLPGYAYAFLLTAVLGYNYVDMDSLSGGPSPEDLGFYVEFLYQRRSSDYLWRSPFSKSAYEEGFENSQGLKDNKRSVLYGRKEIYYLRKAFTKTHVAEFHASARTDGYGAKDIDQNTNLTDAQVYKLDLIELFSVEDMTLPIKRVKFTYDYNLVPGTPNSTAGKLTLRTLAFAYEKNDRGYLSPHEFTYHNETKSYKHEALDRWGNYDESISECKRLHYPYTSQKKSDRAALDNSVGNWQMKDIILPSGGKISVTYESDDYGYVQDRGALQMCDVISPPGASSLEKFPVADDSLVYFVLNDSIPAADISKYFDGLNEIFFKINMKLKRNEANNDMFEYVQGYAKIQSYGAGPTGTNGLVGTGWVRLKRRDNNHPFSVAAWQHLRFIQPELLSESLLDEEDAGSLVAEAMKAVSFVDMIVTVPRLLRNFNSRAKDDGWGNEVKTDYSYIRLNVPDKMKHGGGSRVKRIIIDDRWDVQSADPNQIIGQVYYYENEDGTSSGVAAYEPMMGGEENPFRKAKSFRDDLFLNSDHFQYIEEPSNESYFPSPAVGYSRVKVRSIIADSIISRYPGAPTTSPKISSTGEVVHEFYTARDHPTITRETTIKRRPFRLFGIVPFVGSLTFDNVTATQGYSIVTHSGIYGVPKRVTHYAVSDTGAVNDVPVKTLEYHYTDQSDFLLGEEVNTNLATTEGKEPFYSAIPLMDVEMFADMRESICYNGSLGINGNVEIYFIPAIPPLTATPSVWPSASFGETETKTAVFNKVITKKYVLRKTVLKEAGNISVTTNHIRDAITGGVILSSVNNKFNRKVFTYTIPAYWKYKGMSPAYQSIGLKIPITLENYSDATGELPATIQSDEPNLTASISLGDEFLIASAQYSAIVVCKAINGNQLILEPKLKPLTTVPALSGINVTLMLVRPGRRNQLSDITQTLVTLKDPRQGIQEKMCYPGNQVYMDVNIKTIDLSIQNYLDIAKHILQAASKTEVVRDKHVTAMLPKNVYDKIVTDDRAGTISFSASARGARQQPMTLSLRDKNGNPVNLRNKYKVEEFHVKDTTLQRPSTIPNGQTYSGVSVKITDLQSQQKLETFLYTTTASFLRNVKVKAPMSDDCDKTPSDDEGPSVIYSIDSVLDVSVTAFSDNWPYNKKLLRWKTGVNKTHVYDKYISPYGKGERGIWRSESQFSYVTNRVQHSPVQLQHDGIFTEFIQFDWTKTNGGYCANWVWEKKVTTYSPFDFAIEQTNMLDIPTASLFGHNSSVNIAAARASTFQELGFEGFEEFNANQNVIPETSGSGNIDFATESHNLFDDETIVIDLPEAYNDHFFEIIPSASNIPSIREGIIRGNKGNIDPIPPDAMKNIISIEYYPREGAPVQMDFSANPLHQQGNRYFLQARPRGHSQQFLKSSSYPSSPITKGGKVKLTYRKPLDRRWVTPGKFTEDVVSISSQLAHTGTKSLRVKKNIDFQQTRLKPFAEKTYVFSAWVNLNDASKSTYDLGSGNSENNVGVRIYFTDASNGVFLRPSGPIIEGWQKIEGEFTAKDGNFTIGLQNGNAGVAFFDDLRISPQKSLTETYVYDPKNYRLSAILDNNNFATFYSYDADELYLIRKETDRGIYTIKEIRSHTYEH